MDTKQDYICQFISLLKLIWKISNKQKTLLNVTHWCRVWFWADIPHPEETLYWVKIEPIQPSLAELIISNTIPNMLINIFAPAVLLSYIEEWARTVEEGSASQEEVDGMSPTVFSSSVTHLMAISQCSLWSNFIRSATLRLILASL